MKNLSRIEKNGLAGNRRGMAVIYVALLLFALIAFVGLAIDIGYKYIVWTELQNAADSAALAGAAKLDGTISPLQTLARQEAVSFAQKNKATKQIINIDLNSSNNTAGDIVVGYWDGTNFHETIPAGTVINAIKIITRRSGETGTGVAASDKIKVFFGKVLNIEFMRANASAIAWRPIRPTVPISLCINSCSLSTPTTFFFKQDKKDNTNPPPSEPPPPERTVGWTEFSFTSQAENLGPKSLTAQYIRGEAIPPDVCKKYIYTNNGVGEIVKEFKDEFNKQVKTTGLPYWEVIVPILDAVKDHTELTACPPGDQPLPYQVSHYAIIRITKVMTNPDPGFEVSVLSCIPCDQNSALGKRPYLVK
ncbi:MAG: pilus assembly protein TadG-related protein [Geobacteraceae bacterium]|nr:pilus assembly protein TadG-related protein [Geobacteraceae bacterium]